MFCEKCGTKNDDDATFCEKCGERLPVLEKGADAPKQPASNLQTVKDTSPVIYSNTYAVAPAQPQIKKLKSRYHSAQNFR